MNGFKIRVYALCLNARNQLLILEEWIHGEKVVKFPGGGLEAGEAPVKGLQRELMEELNLCSSSLPSLFYTPEKAIMNHFNPREQVVPLYFRINTNQKLVRAAEVEQQIERIRWETVEQIAPEMMTFNADQMALKALQASLHAPEV